MLAESLCEGKRKVIEFVLITEPTSFSLSMSCFFWLTPFPTPRSPHYKFRVFSIKKASLKNGKLKPTFLSSGNWWRWIVRTIIASQKYELDLSMSKHISITEHMNAVNFF